MIPHGGRVLEALKHKHLDKIRDWYKDSDGVWINLNYGWARDGLHCVHETTVTEAVAAFNKEVVPCACRECRTKGEEWDDYDFDTDSRVIRCKDGTTRPREED